MEPVVKADAGEFAIENLIRNTYDSIERLKAERRKKKEMLESALLNDDAYRQLANEHKEAGRKKAGAKLRVLSDTASKTIHEEVKDITGQLRDQKQALSAYIAEYKAQTKSDTIEMSDGRTYRFTVVHQLGLFDQKRVIRKGRKA